jgi:hypothetical protein
MDVKETGFEANRIKFVLSTVQWLTYVITAVGCVKLGNFSIS